MGNRSDLEESPDDPDQCSEPVVGTRTGNKVKLIAFVATLAGLSLSFKYLPLNEYLGSFFESIQSLGMWGPVLLAVVYIAATVLMVPGTILTLGAGFAFGLVVGTLAVSVGSVLGALLAFLVGRNLARDFVQQQANQYPRFAAVDRAVEQSGFKIVLLTRLSPAFPFNVLNYLFSITKVRTRDYFFASWIGMIPGTIMYVYFGTAIKNLADLAAGRFEGGAGQKAMLVIGLIATVAVTVYITRLAKGAIRDYVPVYDGIAGREPLKVAEKR
ncbi:MAG: TVP38/TMEM64 family protein [Planctomycetales bacterium]|nr:TVP38/TMEM64 family protein [Planctomycetales bacterium]